MIKTLLSRFWSFLKSFQLTIVLLGLLMCLVVLCTLAQVEMGTQGAVNAYMRTFIVWNQPLLLRLPFPGGALVGLLLTFNLIAKTLDIKLTWQKSGMWLVHAGLVVLFAGEFVAGMMQVDTNMSIEVGQTVNYVQSYKEMELAVIDVTDPLWDEVYSVPDSLLSKGGDIAVPGTPITLKVKRFFRNAQLSNLAPGAPPSMATMGVGPGVSVVEAPVVSVDNEMNQTSAFVEPVAGGRSYGIWLASVAIGAPQSFTHEGHTYTLTMRLRRQYLPYAFTLKQFRHDVYPGTDIPKNFSSLVQVVNPSQKESREVLIYMNQPLRYEGKTFYQASFGKNDTLSVLSVVENPGWLLPYVSCVLVSLGLLVHFAIVLRRSLKRRQDKKEG
ncbi:cytochrome c biogenesis protein ResB [Geothrix sp. PMB-07]|uniref:cytochrome c biogenesis protein ResB n=1 Tax=Geothrix sp. PMB-07 TaxID=3068640 RepID=UPI0027412425|nr:cytochrome c biogenesis protein ResB [Geothrix sp. PMB-07]WLT30190.1 cytochrome c biogenesis protein ResB [Geothrix sp. PMB-07]